MRSGAAETGVPGLRDGLRPAGQMLLHPPLAAEQADHLAIVAEDPGRWFVAASSAAPFLVAAPALAAPAARVRSTRA